MRLKEADFKIEDRSPHKWQNGQPNDKMHSLPRGSMVSWSGDAVKLKTLKQDMGSFHYLGARMYTRQAFVAPWTATFRGVRFPHGDRLWLALWSRPKTWDFSEIDGAELIFRNARLGDLYQTVHGPTVSGHWKKRWTVAQGTWVDANWTSRTHEVVMVCKPDEIVLTIDGAEIHRVRKFSVQGDPKNKWPFNMVAHHIHLEAKVGGWPGDPTHLTPASSEFSVGSVDIVGSGIVPVPPPTPPPPPTTDPRRVKVGEIRQKVDELEALL